MLSPFFCPAETCKFYAVYSFPFEIFRLDCSHGNQAAIHETTLEIMQPSDRIPTDKHIFINL